MTINTEKEKTQTMNRDSQSLFEKVKNPQMSPKLQIMDLATLLRLESEGGKATKITIKEIFPQFQEIDWNEIEKFIPDVSWFTDEHSESIHGRSHLTRVVIENISMERKIPLLIAAGMHDVARVDDREDPGHGARAAEWLKNNLEVFEKRGIRITPQQLEEIMVLCTYHEVPDEKIPQEVREQYGQSLQLLKHADLLERFRLPSIDWWPKVEFMANGEVKKLLPLSKYFVQKSEIEMLTTEHDSIAAIKNTAEEIGVIMKDGLTS